MRSIRPLMNIDTHQSGGDAVETFHSGRRCSILLSERSLPPLRRARTFSVAMRDLMGTPFHTRRSFRVIAALVAGCVLLDWMIFARCAAQVVAAGADKEAPAQFVGSVACARCHQVEHREWTGSHHSAAMQEAAGATVKGRFDGATLTHHGVQTTFFRRDGKFWIRTDGPNGTLADFEAKYTFGIYPLQQYLIELPGRRLQAFGIAWDARPSGEGGQRWYHLYPDRKLGAGDPLHWTGVDQNWNYQCAWCHSTNLRKNYDPEKRSFNTEWSEISVGCEACHGAASKHIAWASQSPTERAPTQGAKGFDVAFEKHSAGHWQWDSAGLPARSLPKLASKEITVCAGCHSRRGQFSDSQSEVKKLSDAFRIFRIETPLYHVDGQQRDEVFEYGSFLQSKMHAAGVTCSHCHNPHTGKIRRSGNEICLQCHAGGQFDVPEHHRHTSGSTGAICVSCHMPTSLYMGVHARHDHSMRLPRPDRTISLGTPNACNQCHTNKTAEWAMDAIKSWLPTPKPGFHTFAEAFHAGDQGAPGAQDALIKVVEDDSMPGIVRASALARLGRYPSRKVGVIIARALQMADPEVRSAALSAVSRAGPTASSALLVPLLKDETRLVRMEAARGLAGDAERSLSLEDKQLFDKALTAYVAAQMFNAERPESHTNLGQLYARRGMVAQARASFKEAIAIDPAFDAAIASLADLERAVGDEQAAEAILQQSLQRSPRSATLLHAFGLSLVRQRRYEQALGMLAEAAALAPDEPRFSYVYAAALHGAGRKQEAVDILKAALARHANDREMIMALISYELEIKDFRSALSRAELMMRLEPERADIRRLIDRLRLETR